MSSLEKKLRADLEGEVFFDPFTRGRYATDASHYQIMPVGVVVARSEGDVEAALSHARSEGVPVLPRGGGSSQCGQTVNRALVLDTSKYLNGLVELDSRKRCCTVEPGIVLDELNARLKPHGLWFPVDVSTSSRATIGGMTGNNSAGSRSLKYGIMRDNVCEIEALMADGSRRLFGEIGLAAESAATSLDPLSATLLLLGRREAEEIRARFPQVLRRVAGYNIDALIPRNGRVNLAHLLTGSEGTLAYFRKIKLKLSPLPRNKVLGICHFPTFFQALDAAQHLVRLQPTAVELMDRTMIELAAGIPLFQDRMRQFVRGTPAALLMVEFAEDEPEVNRERLAQLAETMAELGLSWDGRGKSWGGVVEAVAPELQRTIVEIRKSGLNIMMSMKQEGKPISFVEDCAVRLEDLAEFSTRLEDIFRRHNTSGTWYAHASVGCLHVRPILNLRLDQDVRTMRAIAEEAFAMVREYKGSHSGEHGDGIVRSEFHERMFGRRIVEAFAEVKKSFDPKGLFNPGRIVAAPRMDDRSLLRYGVGYGVEDFETVFDWSAWPGSAGGFQGAVEMCNNNGSCRKLRDGSMCPSYRVTRNERDSTRGRANTLRLAISGQLGEGALASKEMAETLKLCVSCKSCRKECPTGVDMARMKIEATAARKRVTGFSVHDNMIAWLPSFAPYLARAPWLGNLRNRLPWLARAASRLDGMTWRRPLPEWRSDIYRSAPACGPENGREVILFGDTFNTYFEKENLVAARDLLVAAGFRVLSPPPADGSRRPLCCGRTFLTAGRIERARREAQRLLDAYAPYAARGVPIVGLEPSCLLCLRDEIPALLKGEQADTVAARALLFEEFCASAGLEVELRRLPARALVHGHCHQKAFGTMAALSHTLELLPGFEFEMIESSCCGMAGVFGYGADTYETSMAMGELSLFPAIRREPADTLIVAAGSSCRHQIAHGTGRTAVHPARLLAMALAGEAEKNSTSSRYRV